jgi:threonine dehydrogenase-like Zn-dependent dehydrogenase
VTAATTSAASVVIERTPRNAFSEVVRPLRRLASDELLLGIEAAGLCGTDIQVVRGMRSETAAVLGHEASCTVLGVGERWAGRYAVGDRVAVNPTARKDPGFLLGHSVDGVLASHLFVSGPAVELGQVVPLPGDLDPVLGVLAEPLACALYSWSIVGAVRPERLVVLGDGTVGHLVAWLAARDLGPDAVVIAGRADMADERDRVHVLRAMRGRSGVVIATPRDSTPRCVRAALENVGAGSVIDVIGGLDPGADPVLQRIVDVRAQNVGGHPHDPRVVDLDGGTPGAPRRVRVTGHRGVSADHLTRASELLLAHGDDLRTLITHEVTPAQAVAVLNDLATTGTRDLAGRRIIKLVIDFRAGATP